MKACDPVPQVLDERWDKSLKMEASSFLFQWYWLKVFFIFFYQPIAFKLQTWQEYWALQLSECKAQCNICQPGPDVKANAQENQITALSLCNIFCVWCLCYLMTHQSKVSDLTDQPYNLKWRANRCPQQPPLSFLWQGADYIIRALVFSRPFSQGYGGWSHISSYHKSIACL